MKQHLNNKLGMNTVREAITLAVQENSVTFVKTITLVIEIVDTCKMTLLTIGIVTLRTVVLDIMTETKLRLIILEACKISTNEALLLFICLFGFLFWSLSSHLSIFHLYWDVTIAGEGLQILTYARYSWPLNSEGSLTCHTHCETGLLFIMVISEDPWHSHCCRAIGSGAVTTCFYDLGLSRPGIEPRSPACEANALPLRPRGCAQFLTNCWKLFNKQ